MLKNFEQIKSQLAELASVINSFKHEAVQLRIVELIFRGGYDQGEPTAGVENKTRSPRRRKSPKKKKPTAAGNITTDDSNGTAKKSVRKKVANSGPMPILNDLINEGFFAKHQTIGQIIKHCRINKVKTFKSTALSGPLGRLVQEKRLKRQKNTDGQFEYWS